MKKTSLVILVALVLVSGASAYAYTEGVFDQILELTEDETEVVESVVEEEPAVIESDLSAFISVNTNFGTNFYSMEEVDDGDNNEVEEIVWDNFTFQFDASESTGNIENYTWDFGDGNILSGIQASHSYELPGKYMVTLSIISPDGNSASSQTEIIVNFDGFVISDNMECTCAPTAKVTQIDLKIEPEADIVSGETTVTHDGSTEDCTQRLVIQQCHLRVTIQEFSGESVVSEEVIFDETFSTNTKTVNFTINPNGNNYKILLETDQIRDWHKPNTEWFVQY
ncbi:MAG: PKD domain-containing protein [Candidatus Thermoplasmatota archaeon]|nr:PKD domain-containing protein [Candidatus Thermoplasmatota archaeon]